MEIDFSSTYIKHIILIIIIVHKYCLRIAFVLRGKKTQKKPTLIRFNLTKRRRNTPELRWV